MKYLDTMIGFREFPDEISLLINITGCHLHCLGCHSPELWEDIGTELTFKELHKLIYSNKGITCIGFMGGNLKEVCSLAEYVKSVDPTLKVGWYTGGILDEKDLLKLKFLDYVKIGPYIKELGGLDSPSTNQRFYVIQHNDDNTLVLNMTYKFWYNGKDNN